MPILLPQRHNPEVGIIAVDGRLLGVFARARLGHLGLGGRRLGGRRLGGLRLGLTRLVAEEVGDEVFGDAGVAGVARGDRGRGDDLRVRVDRGVALVAVEPARGGLVPVPGVAGPRWRSPDPCATRRAIRNTPSGPVSRSWPSTVANSAAACSTASASSAAIQQREHREPVAGPGVDQLLAGGPVVPVDLRLAVADVVVPAAQHRPQLRRPARRSATREQPAHRRADQRDGVHRGHRVIQRGRVQHPPPARPARPRAAASSPTSKIRSGRVERRSRARMSTSTVCANRGPARRRTRRPRPRSASARRRRTGRPPPGPTARPAAATPSPWPPPTAAPNAAPIAEQISEQLVGEQPVPLPRQEPVDRVLRQRLLAEPGPHRRTDHPGDQHAPTSPRSFSRGRHADQGDRHAKDTSHLELLDNTPTPRCCALAKCRAQLSRTCGCLAWGPGVYVAPEHTLRAE